MSAGLINLLTNTEFFDNLAPTQLELVATIGEPVTPEPGTLLFVENEASDDLYIILRGTVEILVTSGLASGAEGSETVSIAQLRAGQVVGEIALVDQGLRTATARIQEPGTQLLRIPRDRLMLLCDTYPELGYRIMANLAADLALKLRSSDLRMRQYEQRLQGPATR